MGRLSDGSYIVPRTEWRQSSEPDTADSIEGEWWYKISTDEIYCFQDGSWSLYNAIGGGDGGDGGDGDGTSGDIGVFGGGYYSSNPYSGSYRNTIDYVTISTPGNATDFGDLTEERHSLVAVSNGADDIGVFGCGWNGDFVERMDYVTISTPGNAVYFGNLANLYHMGSCSNGTSNRGLFAGGWTGTSAISNIRYITISTPGNAVSIANLTQGRYHACGTSNGTNDRGVFSGGKSATYYPDPGYYDNEVWYNTIDYVTISTTGDATDFGDLLEEQLNCSSTSNDTGDIAVVSSGYVSGGPSYDTYNIEYFMISTTGNSSEFGDLSTFRYDSGACSNGTNDRGLFAGGYYPYTYYTIIDYITISSPGNATDFGDLTVTRNSLAATSNSAQ